MDIKDYVVVITGGSRGIGRGIAEEFAKAGAADVIITATTKEGADATVKELSKAYKKTKFSGYALRIENKKEIDSVMDDIVKKHKKIDVLVNNAGYLNQKPFETITEEELDKSLSINFKGAFFTCQKVLPHMKKNKFGKVINISSIGGQIGGPKDPPYAASKAAMICFTKSMARNYSPDGVNVNCIAPDLIETDMTRAILATLTEEQIKQKILLGRAGKPEDIGRVVVFLASKDASYITGQVINVNGGSFMY